MSVFIYLLGVLMQALAAVIALRQVRHAPRRLPWLLISLSSLLIVARRAGTLGEFVDAGRPLAAAEILTLAISALLLVGVVLMARMFREVGARLAATEKAEKALAESEARYRQVVAMISDVIWRYEVDAQGGFVASYISPVADRLLGLPAGTIGDSFDRYFSYVHPDDQATVRQTLAAALSARGPERSIEYRLRCTDGAIRWLRSRGSSHLLSNGHTVAYGTTTDITDHRQAEEALRASLEEKTALLKEVHHRVKNNLQIVSSLLHLQGAAGGPAPELVVLHEAQNRVRSMALIHEVLYSSGNLAKVDFPCYVEALCARLFRGFGLAAQRIRLERRVSDLALDIDRAVPCGLIINELVSNAVKHAFPGERSGCIGVEMGVNAGVVHLRVTDDGCGLPPGLVIEESKTLGLRLICLLARQLKGVVTVARDHGTAVSLAFPLHDE